MNILFNYTVFTLKTRKIHYRNILKYLIHNHMIKYLQKFQWLL